MIGQEIIFKCKKKNNKKKIIKKKIKKNFLKKTKKGSFLSFRPKPLQKPK